MWSLTHVSGCHGYSPEVCSSRDVSNRMEMYFVAHKHTHTSWNVVTHIHLLWMTSFLRVNDTSFFLLTFAYGIESLVSCYTQTHFRNFSSSLRVPVERYSFFFSSNVISCCSYTREKIAQFQMALGWGKNESLKMKSLNIFLCMWWLLSQSEFTTNEFDKLINVNTTNGWNTPKIWQFYRIFRDSNVRTCVLHRHCCCCLRTKYTIF